MATELEIGFILCYLDQDKKWTIFVQETRNGGYETT